MAHLILPIAIEAARYCPKFVLYEGGRMTEGVLTATVIGGTNLASIPFPSYLWTLNNLPIGDLAGDGEISLGVVCADEATFDFIFEDTSSDPDFTVEVYFFVNGVPVDAGVPQVVSVTSLSVDSYTLALGDSACGNIVTMLCSAARSGAAGSDDGVLTVTVTPATVS